MLQLSAEAQGFVDGLRITLSSLSFYGPFLRQLEESKDEEWAPNVCCLSSTGKLPAMGCQYTENICKAVEGGAETFNTAHKKAAARLSISPWRLCPDFKKHLQKIGVFKRGGSFVQHPLQVKGSSYRKLDRNERSCLLIVVGSEDKGDRLGFDRAAIKLRRALRNNFNADVCIIRAWSPEFLASAIHRFAVRGEWDGASQALIYFVGHGDFKLSRQARAGQSWSRKHEGFFNDISESSIRQIINDYVAPRMESVTVAFDCCYAGAFLA